MTDILVCIKRSVDITGEVVLADDGTALDGRFSGYTISGHELAALEIAVTVAEADGGTVTVLTLGGAESAEQLRESLSVGAKEAVHIEADATRYGPADIAAEIAEVVRSREVDGTSFGLILLGNDAADTGDFQVGIRLAHALDRPVVAGVQQLEVAGDQASLHVGAADGTETYEVALPAVATVLEGGVSPRFPTLRGRMRARKGRIERIAPVLEPRGTPTLGLRVPPAAPSQVTVLGEGPGAAPALVEVLRRNGVVS